MRLVQQLRRASGHASMRHIVRLLVDAKKPRWMVELARNCVCDTCNETKEGGQMVPQASVFPIPQAWEAVGMDVAEIRDAKNKVT